MMRSGEDQLSLTFAALANSTRRAIIARLAQGEATVNELAEPFNMSLPAISKHIKVLERAGLIIQGQKAQYRPCTIDVTPVKKFPSGQSSTALSGRHALTAWTTISIN